MRPALKTGLLPVWRDRDTLQFGLDPRRAVALGGLDQTAAVISLLDGSRDRDTVIATAQTYGVPPEAAGRVLALLAAAGVLDDFPARTYAWMPEQLRARLAPELATASLAYGDGDGGARTLARRRSAYVRVHGAGRTGACVASFLAASGVGHVSCADPEPAEPADLAPAGLVLADLGQPRQAGAARAIERAAPEVRTGDDGAVPDLVILTGLTLPGLTEQLMRDRVPHLALRTAEAIGVVGPLVRPAEFGLPELRGPAQGRGRPAVAEDLGPGYLRAGPAAGLRYRARRHDGHPGLGAGAGVHRPPGDRPGDRGRNAGGGAARLAVAPPDLAPAPGLRLWRIRDLNPYHPPSRMRDNVGVNDVPMNPVTRAAKMARLPIGLAGRTAIGVGKRIGGRSAEVVAQEIQQRTADQIFRVLGELKGGAMKLGQALSIFEAALPPEIAGPYRATLTKLQESAPPLPARTVHQVLARELGADWRDDFAEFNDTPAAAASIGQVHEAVWRDGRRVAVKIQYPGAGRALIGDFNQLSRAGLFGLLMPGLDVKPLLDELKDRVAEELNYELEAMSQQTFADAYAGDPDIYVPDVVMATEQVLVSDWMEGTPLSKIISDGSKEERDRAGILLVRFLFSGPSRAGLLHADPHPGNFRLLDDGRLGVLDFGAVDRLPGGLPPFFGRLLRIMHDDDDADIEEVERELRAHGFLRPGIDVDLDALHAFLAPLAEPSKVDCFKFSREWLREEATRVTDLRASNITRKFNVPPSYVLIHRVSTAGIGVLCQLECEGEFRAEVLKWIPGYFDAPTADLPDPGARAGQLAR